MYKLIITKNAYEYLNGDSVEGINFMVDDIEEALAHVETFVKKQFAIIVEEDTY